MPTPVPPDRLFRQSKTLHRSTQELSLAMAELEMALTREESARFQQALAAQQKVRIVGAIALAITSVFIREGLLTVIAFAVAIAGAYLFVVLRMSSARVQSTYARRRDMIPLAVADAAVVTAFAALAAAGGEEETILWILLAGAVVAPALAYSFGNRTGITSFVMFGVGYLMTDLLLMGFKVTHAEPLRIVATAALWGGIVWPFMRFMTQTRERLDNLRTYAKLAEVGDVGTSDLLIGESGSDDFALIASSLQKVHARLSEQVGSDPLTGCARPPDRLRESARLRAAAPRRLPTRQAPSVRRRHRRDRHRPLQADQRLSRPPGGRPRAPPARHHHAQHRA
jgi:hypothetical protein